MGSVSEILVFEAWSQIPEHIQKAEIGNQKVESVYPEVLHIGEDQPARRIAIPSVDLLQAAQEALDILLGSMKKDVQVERQDRRTFEKASHTADDDEFDLMPD